MKKVSKTAYIQIRLTPDEKDVLFTLAISQGKTVSELLRSIIPHSKAA